MGQYHSIYNVTKQEVYHGIGGIKLCEQASSYAGMLGLMVLLCNSNGRGGGDLQVYQEYDSDTREYLPLSKKNKAFDKAIKAVQGRWAGDQIVVQGDYAKAGDSGFILNPDSFKDITPLVAAAVEYDTDTHATIHFEKKLFPEKFKVAL